MNGYHERESEDESQEDPVFSTITQLSQLRHVSFQPSEYMSPY